MKFCPKCKKDYSNFSNFCYSCGGELKNKREPKCPKCKISMFNAKMEYNFARISGMGVICKNCGCEISNEWLENPEERVQKASQQQEKNIADAERIAKENKNKVKKSEEE